MRKSQTSPTGSIWNSATTAPRSPGTSVRHHGTSLLARNPLFSSRALHCPRVRRFHPLPPTTRQYKSSVKIPSQGGGAAPSASSQNNSGPAITSNTSTGARGPASRRTPPRGIGRTTFNGSHPPMSSTILRSGSMKNHTLQRQAPRLPRIHVEHLNSVTIVENEFNVHKVPLFRHVHRHDGCPIEYRQWRGGVRGRRRLARVVQHYATTGIQDPEELQGTKTKVFRLDEERSTHINVHLIHPMRRECPTRPQQNPIKISH